MEQQENLHEQKGLKDIAIETIKTLGINHKAAIEVVNAWKAAEDREIATLSEDEKIDAEIDSLIYEAEICFEAGEKGIAIEHLKDAADFAMSEKKYDAAKKISDKMDEFSK